MRSTSSGRRYLSVLLCVLLAVEWTGLPALSSAGTIEEPCILLKFSSPSVPESFARKWLDPMQGLLEKDLRVRWVAPRPSSPATGESVTSYPEPDDASIERISGTIARALRAMDAMETGKAGKLLSEAEAFARKFRAGKTLRPFFAEIFLRRGVLLLWKGDRNGAEELFARSRLLRPDFSPDPALFSPAFRESWNRSGDRPEPVPEILVHSLPPGAAVSLNGKPAGVTPGRFKVRSCDPVLVRVSLPGYQETVRTGQWLPGDSESIDADLVRDRVATLGESLVVSPEGKGSAGLLKELAEGAGASRVAVCVLEQRNGTVFMKVLSSTKDGSGPAFLGEIRLGEGDAEETAKRTSVLLAGAGWPAVKPGGQEVESSWYHRKWFWILLGAVAIGAIAAAGGGGGGGGSGSSTGSIGVTF